MKKNNLLIIALIAITCITSQMFAQVATSKSLGKTMAADDWQQAPSAKATGQHIKEGIITCRVVATADGCSIVFENDVVSPRDAASGLATGKRMHKPFSFVVSSIDNSVTEVTSPRDAATGLATGRREGKISVIAVSHDMAKASPKLLETVAKGRASSDSPPADIAIDEPGVKKAAQSGMGSGKVSVSDLSIMSAGKATFKEFTITKRCDGKTTKLSVVDGVCDIPLDDCPDGSCSLIASWSWGTSNPTTTTGGGAGSGRCSVDFLLEIKNGACWDLAVQKK